MATVKRIYQKVGVDGPKIENLLQISCTITANTLETIEIEYDDTIAGITETLDYLMQQEGCVFDGTPLAVDYAGQFVQAAEPTTTEVPATKWCIWKETGTGKVYMGYRDGAALLKVELV